MRRTLFIIFLLLTRQFSSNNVEEAKVELYKRSDCQERNDINILYTRFNLYNILRKDFIDLINCPKHRPWSSNINRRLCCKIPLRKTFKESGVGRWLLDKNRK